MKKYKFRAKIIAGDGGGTGVLFPYDTQQEFGIKGRVPIHATFDGLPYTGSLIKYGFPQHTLHLPKATREQLGKVAGDSVEVVVWKDDSERVLEVPVELQKLMEKESLLSFFDSLSYTHRKEYCRWISEAKREETRSRRLEKAIEMLRNKVKTPG
jgi:bifunctional DNA-binding transcriptional regulator/antitoxin component of YhaV-PrlF toxin-antitoxin module